MRERWLVVWDCQSFGLANCIEAIARDVACEGNDFRSFATAVEADPHLWQEWDRIIATPMVKSFPGFDQAGLPHVELVPPIRFGGFHPDCDYVLAGGQTISGGVVGPYHSKIALAAHLEGLDAAAALPWFTADVYRRTDYLSRWSSERSWVLEQYRRCGVDAAGLFRTAGRGRSFMHTPNHPTIDALYQLARAFLIARERRIFVDAPTPPDNLAGTSWPVYPEIGERLAIAGTYLFRPENQHKPIELAEFLSRSMACFDAWPRQDLHVGAPTQPGLLRLREIMRERAR